MNALNDSQNRIDAARYKARIDQLIDEAVAIAAGNYLTAKIPLAANLAGGFANAWHVSASNLVAQLCKPSSHYYKAVCERSLGDGLPAGTVILELSTVLARLKEDLNRGLLTTVFEQAQGETLQSLLDQAVDHHRHGRLAGAGILVSAVFEDAVRRLVAARELETKGTNLDALITALAQAGVCSAAAAPRWRAAAMLRNKALHAQWDEFTLQDVGAAIALVTEIVETNMVSPL